VNQAAGTIELVTGADSIVKLKLNAGNLEGSFQLRNNGQTFHVTLAHGPQPKSAPAQAQEYKWRVQATLQNSGALGSCGSGQTRTITIKDNVLVAMGEAGSAWTILLKGLKPDGSGELVGKTAQGNHKVTFKFAAGTGPRLITMHYENSICIWDWIPF
jgi:hypothetical protein